jgi:nitrile hydratase
MMKAATMTARKLMTSRSTHMMCNRIQAFSSTIQWNSRSALTSATTTSATSATTTNIFEEGKKLKCSFSTTTKNTRLPHDIGGDILSYGTIVHHVGGGEIVPLENWEVECHSMFAVLASRGIVGTDELRRSIEALTPAQYDSWSYYEKWSAAMTTLLLEHNVITQHELQQSLFGDMIVHDDVVSEDTTTSTTTSTTTPKQTQTCFDVGDAVRVLPYHNNNNNNIEWRRPHMRTPGYIYGVRGTIERVCGIHGDPSFLAFGVPEPPQVQLYRVRFATKDIWPEQYPNSTKHHHDHGDHDDDHGDVVEVEIYQHWLEAAEVLVSANNSSSDDREPTLFDHTSDGADCTHDHHDDHHDHDHDHHHDDHHDHVHEPRKLVEERAAAAEGPPRPGKELFQSIRSILLDKNIISADDIRTMVERMDTAGKRLDGATLVVAAWQDASFAKRLVANATAAASELGISTSNPNAPTVLTVVPNTPTTHNLIVCTLCSCYPSGLLGIAPSWYKSKEYRARAVREPRVVLANDFGVVASEVNEKQIRVHDSTADHRYLVLPERPAGTEGWSDEELRALVTRDTMLGVSVPTSF